MNPSEHKYTGYPHCNAYDSTWCSNEWCPHKIYSICVNITPKFRPWQPCSDFRKQDPRISHFRICLHHGMHYSEESVADPVKSKGLAVKFSRKHSRNLHPNFRFRSYRFCCITWCLSRILSFVWIKIICQPSSCWQYACNASNRNISAASCNSSIAHKQIDRNQHLLARSTRDRNEWKIWKWATPRLGDTITLDLGSAWKILKKETKTLAY